MASRTLFCVLLGLSLILGAPAATAAAPSGATPEDLAAQADANPFPLHDKAAVAVTGHADGMVSTVLDDSITSTIVVRIGPDGGLIFGCVSSRAEYDAFFAPAPVPTALEVR